MWRNILRWLNEPSDRRDRRIRSRRFVRFEQLEDRRLMAVALTWNGTTLQLTDTPGSTPTTVTIATVKSPRTGNLSALQIDLGQANFAVTSTAANAALGLTYGNNSKGGQYADIDLANSALYVAQANVSLPADQLDLAITALYNYAPGVSSLAVGNAANVAIEELDQLTGLDVRSTGNITITGNVSCSSASFVAGGDVLVANLAQVYAYGGLDVKSAGNIAMEDGAAIRTGGPSFGSLTNISLAADVDGNGLGIGGAGTISLAAGATVAAYGNVGLRAAQITLDTSSHGALVTALPTQLYTAGGAYYEYFPDISLGSSRPDLPITIGNVANAGGATPGIVLSNAELARIQPAGRLLLGDGNQTGTITFLGAGPINANVVVQQKSNAAGQIVLDGGNASIGLDVGKHTVSLSPGTGGVVARANAHSIPLATAGFTANGIPLTLVLTAAPAANQQYTVIDNTSGNGSPIVGNFANAPQGSLVPATYGNTTYWFQPNYAGGSGGNLVLSRYVAASRTTASGSPDPAVVGDAVTLTANVTGSPGALFGNGTVPGGIVDFYDSTLDNDLGNVALSNGIATHSVANLGVGNHTIRVTYFGDGNFAAGNVTFVEEVDRANVAIAANAARNPAVFGEAITLTATVGGNGATPSGNVDFYDLTTGRDLGNATLAAGTAALGNRLLGVGNHTIRVTYFGDGNFAAGNVTFVEEVDRANTSTTLASVGNPATFGQSVTLMAIVAAASPGNGAPTGTVTFRDMDHGNVVIGVGNLTVSGGVEQASVFNWVPGAAGKYTILATYSGDGNFAGSGRNLVLPVSLAPTNIVFPPQTTVTTYGGVLTLTADVAAPLVGNGAPTGLVTFYDLNHGNVAIGSANLGIVNGVDQVSLPNWQANAAGMYTILAVYAGDANFAGSSSQTNYLLNRAPVSLSLSSQSARVGLGQPGTLTATLASPPGTGPVTGEVQFIDTTHGNMLIGVAKVTSKDGGGQAVLSNWYPTIQGTQTIEAVYVGDDNFAMSGAPAVVAVNVYTASAAPLPASGLPIASPGHVPTVVDAAGYGAASERILADGSYVLMAERGSGGMGDATSSGSSAYYAALARWTPINAAGLLPLPLNRRGGGKDPLDQEAWLMALKGDVAVPTLYAVDSGDVPKPAEKLQPQDVVRDLPPPPPIPLPAAAKAVSTAEEEPPAVALSGWNSVVWVAAGSALVGSVGMYLWMRRRRHQDLVLETTVLPVIRPAATGGAKSMITAVTISPLEEQSHDRPE